MVHWKVKVLIVSTWLELSAVVYCSSVAGSYEFQQLACTSGLVMEC
jgi:hypothetical protein